MYLTHQERLILFYKPKPKVHCRYIILQGPIFINGNSLHSFFFSLNETLTNMTMNALACSHLNVKCLVN